MPSKEALEDSDSSDGTHPSTPKKGDRQQTAPMTAPSSGLKHAHNQQTSPFMSPTKQQHQHAIQQEVPPPPPLTGPSPRRNLFSRPSKMSIRTDAKEIANKDQTKETASSSNPGNYFAETSGHHQTFSNLLKHAGNHVPHPHLHSNSSKVQSSTPSYGSLPRGKSFDMLRAAAVGDASYGSPISPSFFSSSARSASFSAFSADQDDNWPLICARVLPLFNGEGLRQPIEDLNRLVSTHLRRLIDRHEESHLVEDLTELFDTGTRSLDNNLAALPDEKLVNRLSEIWVFYFSTVLPYLEATFLPITIEFANSSASFFAPPTNDSSTSTTNATVGAADGSSSSSTTTTTTTTTSTAVQNISIHSIACKSYRDILILPLYSRLLPIFTTLPHLVLYQHSSSTPGTGGSEVFGRLLQCISVLRRVQSGDEDENQRKCDELGKAAVLYKKGKGDRRGIIGEKKNVFHDASAATGLSNWIRGDRGDTMLGEVIDEAYSGEIDGRGGGVMRARQYYSDNDDQGLMMHDNDKSSD